MDSPKDLPSAPEIGGFGVAPSGHAVCGPGSAYGRDPLHKAVCEMDLSTLQSDLSLHLSTFLFELICKGWSQG